MSDNLVVVVMVCLWFRGFGLPILHTGKGHLTPSSRAEYAF